MHGAHKIKKKIQYFRSQLVGSGRKRQEAAGSDSDVRIEIHFTREVAYRPIVARIHHTNYQLHEM